MRILSLLLALGSGDVDGDGCDDVVVADHGERVSIFSGQTGERLASFRGDGEQELRWGANAETLLVTTPDSRVDVLVYDPVSGHGGWFSPDGTRVGFLPSDPRAQAPERTHSLLYARAPGGGVFVRHGLVMPDRLQHPNGVDVGMIFAIDVVGDADQDGVTDFVVARGYGRDDAAAPSAIISGRDGATLHELQNGEATYASAVATVGDLDGDGANEVAVGTLWTRTEEQPYVADERVTLYSSVDGSKIRELRPSLGPDERAGFGARVLPLGDVDADDVDDFAVSATAHDLGPDEARTGSVTVFSGKTGARHFTLFGWQARSGFGHHLRSPGDADGDGVADLFIRPRGGRPWVLVSGADGALLWAIRQNKEVGYTRAHGFSVEPIAGHGPNVLRLVRRH